MRDEAGACRDCYWNNHTELNLMMSKKRVTPDGDYSKESFSQPIPDSLIKHIEPAVTELV